MVGKAKNPQGSLLTRYRKKVNILGSSCLQNPHQIWKACQTKKPFLSCYHRYKCLNSPEQYWDFDWHWVLWSDLKKVELSGNKHSMPVWYEKKDDHIENNLIPTVKYASKGYLIRVHGIIYYIKYQDIQNICPDQHKHGLLSTQPGLCFRRKPLGNPVGWAKEESADEDLGLWTIRGDSVKRDALCISKSNKML